MSKHPDDACRCGTTRNGAESPAPIAHSWSWRGATYQTHSEQRHSELRRLQAAIDYWAVRHPHPSYVKDEFLVRLFDRAVDHKPLADAILAHICGMPIEYQVGSDGKWNGPEEQGPSFYPSFDGARQWRPHNPKPKRPHADLIEKRLEDVQWFFRGSSANPWSPCSPAFSGVFEYKFEPHYCAKRKAMVRDWLSGTEYEYHSTIGWVATDANSLLTLNLDRLRKKPTTQKLRTRTAVMKSTVSGGLPFTKQALTDEQEAYIAGLKQFIRWMGPWQEVEVEAQ